MPLPAPTEEQLVALRGRAKMLMNALALHLKTGAHLADDETLRKRKAACESCLRWFDAGMFYGLGGCKLCGCNLPLKLRLATSSCPDKPARWGPVTKPG